MVPQASVLAPLIGSLHGTQRWSAWQLPVSSVGRVATAGRQTERHRPGAEVPSKATQFSRSTLPPAEMRSSGAHRPAVAPVPHVASCEADDAGTYAFGRQCAPPQAGAQSGRLAGSITAGPCHGHLRITGGFAG